MPTTPGGLPYPSYLDASDGPDAIMDLALALDTALAAKSASSHSHTIATLPTGTSSTQVSLGNHTHTNLPNHKPSFSTDTVTTDANGEATVTHGAGFTPDSGVMGLAIAEAGTDVAAVQPISGSFTATQFRFRAYWVKANIAIAGSVHVWWIIW
jgi:hypothetical protein